MVMNGYEVCSGGVRNHNPEVLYRVFDVLDFDKQYVNDRFGAKDQRVQIRRATACRLRIRYRPHVHGADGRGKHPVKSWHSPRTAPV